MRMNALRLPTVWASCCTWAISFMNSFGIPKIARRGCMTGRSANSSAMSTARKSRTSTFPLRCTTTAPFIAPISMTPICKTRPAQTRKVAANQAFFEFQPARMAKPGGPSLDKFAAPHVTDTPVTQFDDHGLGQEPNNLTAIGSLTGYRALRWGKNVELIVTDQRSYRSEDPTDHPEADALESRDFLQFVSQEALEILDAGRTYDGGKPPSSIHFGKVEIPNYRKDQPPQTILGAAQKKWFLERLQNSRATWKIWGNTTGTLDLRADLQNLPEGIGKPWPIAGYAASPTGDHGVAYFERGEIYDFIRDHGITGFATVAGDRHSFWAGLAAKGR